MNIYNENDPFCARWLLNLVLADHLPNGYVCDLDIQDLPVAPQAGDWDLQTFTQAHFFAGIGVWSYALRQAGWPGHLPVWTGSCPCQPFSNAGSRKGLDDERHLWPAWFRLIDQCRPPVIFGEQVASKDGLKWLDLVQADLQVADYSVGAVDLSAAWVGAPHIRQRLYWVALANSNGLKVVRKARLHADGQAGHDAAGRSEVGRLGDTRGDGDLKHARIVPGYEGEHAEWGPLRSDAPEFAGAVGPAWSNCDWVYCQDGRYRPVESGTFPLAPRTPTRVGRLRAYGNALEATTATTFIRSVMDL